MPYPRGALFSSAVRDAHYLRSARIDYPFHDEQRLLSPWKPHALSVYCLL